LQLRTDAVSKGAGRLPSNLDTPHDGNSAGLGAMVIIGRPALDCVGFWSRMRVLLWRRLVAEMRVTAYEKKRPSVLAN